MENTAEIGPRLPGIARRAIASWLVGEGFGAFRPAGPRAAVFVTLRRSGGALRGCVGSLAASRPDVVSETAHSAVMAATQDPRFSPVTAAELAGLSIEVSVLGPEELLSGPDRLDPREYGVVVRDGDGHRGLLLPGLDEVRDSAHQIELACRKAGIDPGGSLSISRFRVEKWSEGARP